MKLRIHREAEAEIDDAQAWYDDRSETAARAFELEVSHAIQLILEAPYRYPKGGRGERRFVVDQFPYTITYRILDDTVFITAFAHQSRRPGYWRHRR